MSNQQGDRPPPAAPAGAYGPGHTLLGEPAFVEEAAPAAFPAQAQPAAQAPFAGAMVPSTIVDAQAYVPQPQYPGSPYAGGTAPAAGFGMPNGPVPPTVGYGAPAPNPYGGPPPPAYPAAPPRRAQAGAGGPSMILIGVVAFAVIGGLTTFLALRGRGGGEDSDKPIPTIDVPPVATVPSDPGAGSGADPGEPPAVEPPIAPPPVVATHPVPKPTSTAPKPIPTTPTPTSTAPKPIPTTPTPTSTTKPPPSPTTPTSGAPPGHGPVLIPRHPIPRTR